MATVARMPASNTSTEKNNGKAPSCGAESELYFDSDSVGSGGVSKSTDWEEDHGRVSDGGAASSSTMGHQMQSGWQQHQQERSLDPTGNTASQGAPKPLDTAAMPQDAPGLISSEESTRSLQEIFESDDVESIQQRPFGMEPTDSDDWFNGDADLLEKDERKMSSTPPLSLYAAKKPESQYGNNGSYLPAKWTTAPSSIESGGATPTSNSGSVPTSNLDINDGSISSNSSNTPRTIGNPILYSAIGSLESPNAISAESFTKRLNAPGKEFSKLGTKSLLIPPANQVFVANQVFAKLDRTVRTDNRKTAAQTGSTSSGPKTQQNEPTAQPNHAARPKITKTRNDVAKEDKQFHRASTGDIANHAQKPSNLRSKDETKTSGRRKSKRVSYNKELSTKKPVEMFRPSCDAYTPRIEKKSIKYRAAELRTPVQKMATPMGTLQRPNFRDALRRVAMIIHQHIVKIERRFEDSLGDKDNGLFKQSMKETFEESKYRTPTYKCTMVRIPMARPGMVYGLKKIKTKQEIPSEEEIYEFGHQLFKAVQLSSECSIVCLIYVERLMEAAKVPLLACTWRPIFMCGLLLASKVWQDLSSWNIEFASVYPQYSLDAINRLELNFLRMVKWDLYISSSLYAKYYFALRSLVEKVSFRQRYNRMVGGVDSVAQSEALKIQKRTEQVKEEALLQLSRSM